MAKRKNKPQPRTPPPGYAILWTGGMYFTSPGSDLVSLKRMAFRCRDVVGMVHQGEVIWLAPGHWPVWEEDGETYQIANGLAQNGRWCDRNVVYRQILTGSQPPSHHCGLCGSPIWSGCESPSMSKAIRFGYLEGHPTCCGYRICSVCERGFTRSKIGAGWDKSLNAKWLRYCKNFSDREEKSKRDGSHCLLR